MPCLPRRLTTRGLVMALSRLAREDDVIRLADHPHLAAPEAPADSREEIDDGPRHSSLISRIKRTVSYQLRLNPAYIYFPCSRCFAWVFPSACPPRYNEDFPKSLVGEPPWTPPWN